MLPSAGPETLASGKAAAKPPGDYSIENTGYNFAPVKTFESYVSSTPTSCDMQRPKSAP